MQITDVRIQLLKNPRGKLRAFATLTFDNSLVIQDFKVFAAENHNFIGMPGSKMPDKTWKDLVFAIDTSLQETIKNTILRAYEDETRRPEYELNNR